MTNANPAKRPAKTIPSPYVAPRSNAVLEPLFLELEAAVVVAPPRPLKTEGAVFVEVEVVDAIVAEVVVLTRTGFWAPQGWSSLQAL